jgi:hypothetical protein
MTGAEGRGPAARREAGASRTVIFTSLAALLWLGAGCTDPRQRPTPPTVVLTLSTTVRPTSPGDILGSLYLYDPNGITSVRTTVDLDNGRQVGDSTIIPADAIETTRPFLWRLPGGVPVGTRITIVVRALSYIGFEASDTVVTAVADSV